MTPYPLHLNVAGRLVVVVGGGPVAARRAMSLADAGALVDVVAPWVCEEIVGDTRLRVRRAEFHVADLDGAWLVHTATGDRVVDDAVAAEAERLRIWCVRADDAEVSSAWTPAVLRRDDVVVSVTAGRDPRRATSLRDAVAARLDAGGLPLRRHRHGVGHVALVGGGPGDPGLITTRGRALLAQADVVVVDRLAPRSLLEELDDDVEVIDAGKAPHAHTLTQSQIEELLVDRAQAGLRVVRLKGGDPYVLGRGGEEALACIAAGVAVEIVPGVTSAVAVPALAGIPVTHRGLARGFTVVSAHDNDVDWAALGRVEGTLVILMGVGRLAEAAVGLVAAGLASSTPVAVIEDGSTPRQRTTIATLSDIAEVAAARGVRSPAVVVVGEVVRLAGALAGCETSRTSGRPKRLTTSVIVAAHGSPDPRHAETVNAIVEGLQARGVDASVGWLGHGTPALADAVVAARAKAVVVPLLLAGAFHAQEDVPAAAGDTPTADVLVPDPAAPDPRLIDALVARLVEAGGASASAIVLASVGAKNPAHALVAEGVAVALAARVGAPVGTAYATAVPDVATAARALRARGVSGPLAVAALFIAPGLLYDRVVREAAQLGVSAVAEPLGAHPALLDLLAARAASTG